MRLLFTAQKPGWDAQIDPRFGRAAYLVLYDETTGDLESIDNTEAKEVEHGAGTTTAQKVYDLKPDVLVTGNGPGNTAATILKRLPMKIYVGAENQTLREAYQLYKDNKLELSDCHE